MSSASYEDLYLRRQRALEEAAAWRVHLQEVPLTYAERQAFTDWLRESPLHVAAMLRVSQTDSALAAFDRWDDLGSGPAVFDDTVIEWPVSAPHGPTSSQPRALGKPRWVSWCVAAALAVAGIGTALWSEGVVGGSVFQTTTGERREVALEDGSTLLLGAQTRVRVQFSATERDVTLERGEAVFKVAKNPTRPFIVIADDTRVRAVGTEFGVEQRQKSVVVTVAEGRVAVTEGSATRLPLTRPDANESAVALAPDEQIEVRHAGAASAVRKVDSESSLAWARGRLVFTNDSLGFVVERFNQYNRIRITVTDPQIAARRVSGSFDAMDLESLLTFLRGSLGVAITWTRDGAEIHISPGATATTTASTF
jgi:transmembrane sensor